ncbi:ribonuclease H family protein [Fervidibacillus halotolerans]|uniref:Ribonuclease H n=1 Tax=Fervidibacillus halotolerans TaxID=2980027 RepID=A0A9E8M198_9BACI|nr:ribonuclease H family protein [Fervidibacillus halotolerans]WAA13117.1 ribonuclease H family protein [Fervidibacillus halotolerans]
MGKRKTKYYVVWVGKKTGIFSSWDECKQHVLGVSEAKYKSFSSLEEAKQAYHNGWEKYYGVSKENKRSQQIAVPENKEKTYIEESICVDAACSGNPGQMEYKGVYTKTGKVLFHYGPILGTNNIGEFLAIVHALSFLKKYRKDNPIYSDSVTAMKWVRAKKANTTLIRNKDTERVWKLIERAELWLQTNDYNNPILKWETDIWGEIKADFGRK